MPGVAGGFDRAMTGFCTLPRCQKTWAVNIRCRGSMGTLPVGLMEREPPPEPRREQHTSDCRASGSWHEMPTAMVRSPNSETLDGCDINRVSGRMCGSLVDGVLDKWPSRPQL